MVVVVAYLHNSDCMVALNRANEHNDYDWQDQPIFADAFTRPIATIDRVFELGGAMINCRKLKMFLFAYHIAIELPSLGSVATVCHFESNLPVYLVLCDHIRCLSVHSCTRLYNGNRFRLSNLKTCDCPVVLALVVHNHNRSPNHRSGPIGERTQ